MDNIFNVDNLSADNITWKISIIYSKLLTLSTCNVPDMR